MEAWLDEVKLEPSRLAEVVVLFNRGLESIGSEA
jgi:hypothetical protein